MKWIRKMVPDWVSPVALNMAAAPAAVARQPEVVLIAVLEGIRRAMLGVEGSRDAATPADVTATANRSTVKPASRMLLVKASTRVTENRSGSLCGKSVLCVGGRMQLYPAYRDIVEDAGGRFLSFHGANDAALGELQVLLKDADLVVCPVDCVRHDAFFVTKNYCERYQKPCVMLDKAKIATFCNGVRRLKQFAAA